MATSVMMGQSQKKIIREIIRSQKKLNKEYANKKTSVLTPEDFKTFEGLEFYPIDLKYRVRAIIKRTPNAKPFKMKTSTDRLPEYVKYGDAYFTIDGTDFIVPVYQNMALSKKEEYKDYLFFPFTDLTSGDGSYGGGRYLDLRIPEGDFVIIDFNKSYNPYCAYNHKYSCPIPPEENDIKIRIEAGIKAFKHH